MNREKLLTILVFVLILINLSVMGFMLFSKKKKGPDRHGPMGLDRMELQRDKKMRKTFNFDDDQMKKFVESKTEYKRKMDELRPMLNDVSMKYYQLGLTEKNKIQRDSLLTIINDINSQVYKSNMKHFDDIREMCDESQMHELDKFINKLLNNHKGKNRRGPGKDNGHKPRHRKGPKGN